MQQKKWQIQSLVLTGMLSHISKHLLQSYQQMWQGKYITMIIYLPKSLQTPVETDHYIQICFT